jgi:hypothetical protein
MTDRPQQQPMTSDMPIFPEKPNSAKQAFLNDLKADFYGVDVEFIEDLKTLAVDPQNEGRFMEDIHRTIKKDDAVISDTFHSALSAYLDPFSLAHKERSGAGKTYVSIGTVSYFPKEDVVIVGTQSPKVISHEQGELMTIDENGNETPLDLDEAPHKPMRREYDGKEEFQDAYDAYKIKKRSWDQLVNNSFHLIRLTGKIYVFLDTISRETFEMFKCTLSHDDWRITHKYVDDTGKVHTTVLEGWPSAIFCTVDKDFIEEFATRTLTDSPETDKGKISAAQEVTDSKRSFPWEYEQDTKEKKLIKALIRNIRDTVKKYSLRTVMPFPNLRTLVEFSSEAIRDMRDYEHFNQILPTFSAFKLFQRPIITVNGKKYIVVAVEDVLAALDLFDKIAETTRTGTEKPILDFYHKHVQHHKGGAILKVILADAPEMRSENTARQYLARLEQLGWVNIAEGQQTDKRLLTYYPLKDATDTQREISETALKQRDNVDLKQKLEKDFNEWFKTITTANPSIQIEKINFNGRTLHSITVDELKNLIGIGAPCELIVLNEARQPIRETKAETTLKPEINTVAPNSQKSNIRLTIRRTKDGQPCWNCGQKASEWEIKTYLNNEYQGTAYNCDGCIKNQTIPSYRAQGAKIEIGSQEPAENDLAKERGSDFYEGRFCSKECKNYNGENCPFRNKLTEKGPLPRRCYGYAAPNPGGDS